MKVYSAIAVRTPMSRTRRARPANSADSSAGRPKSLTRVAPGAENRSVIRVLMAELCSAASRRRAAMRRPVRRAGRTKRGSRTRASRVTCQERPIMTTKARTSVATLETMPARVSLKARWAPMTSLLRRLTRAPVRVRVKKATGIRWTWSKTAVRRSRMSPSPRRELRPRATMPSPASATAMAAMSSASRVTRRVGAGDEGVDDLSGEDGVATASSAVATLSTTNQPMRARCGRAKAAMRRTVARARGRRSCSAWRTL